MKTTEYVHKIKNYIAIDEVQSAIQELQILVHGTYLADDVILLSGRFNDFLRHVRNDILKEEDARIIKSRIRYDVIELLKVIELNKAQFEQEIDKGEQEYLQLVERYYDNMPVKELDKLSRDLKRLGQSLFDLDFITNRLQVTEDKGIVFGALCAIQVNPNPRYYNDLVQFLNKIAENARLHDFRLRIVYRLVMCLENIINLDNYRIHKEINAERRETGKLALQKLAMNSLCRRDDEVNGTKGIGNRIQKTIKKL